MTAKNPVMSCHPILEHTHLDGQQGWAGLYDESRGAFPSPTLDKVPVDAPNNSSGDSSDSSRHPLPNDAPKNDAPKAGPLYNRFPIVACSEEMAPVLKERWNMPMNPCRLSIAKEGGAHKPSAAFIQEVHKTFADSAIKAIRIFNDASPEGWGRQKEIAVPDVIL